MRRGQACRKRKEERIKKIENKFDAGDYTLVEYLVLQVDELFFSFFVQLIPENTDIQQQE